MWCSPSSPCLAYYRFADFSAKLWWFPISRQPDWLTRFRSRKSSSHFVPYRCPPWASWFPIVPRAASSSGGACLAIGDLAISNFIDAMLHPRYRRPKSSRGTEVSGTLLSEVEADAGHEKDLLLQFFAVQYHIAKWWLWPGFSFNAAYFPAMQCHSHIYLFSILSLVYASHSTYAPKINLVGFRELE
jgi:hypothetical protein